MFRSRAWLAPLLVGILAFVAGASGATILLIGPLHYRTIAQAKSSPVAALTSSSPSVRPSPSPLGAPPHVSAPPSPTPSPQNGPRARRYAMWTYDAQTHDFVLFGGAYATGNYHEFIGVLDDTWTWDGTKWTKVILTGAAPAGRFGGSACYDPVHNVVVFHGGLDTTNVWHYNDTWTWDGTAWKLPSPDQTPPNFGPQPMDWNAAKGVAYAFVYAGQQSVTPPDQTWSWNGATWAQLTAVGAPTGHNGEEGAMAYDKARRVMVYFDHVNGQPTTWTFDGSAWTLAATGAGTDSRRFTMASDDVQSTVVLFGENGDTWTWDGTRWTAQNPKHAPQGRFGASLTYDSAHGVDVLFGGASGQLDSYKEYDDVWSWNGFDWTQVSAGP